MRIIIAECGLEDAVRLIRKLSEREDFRYRQASVEQEIAEAPSAPSPAPAPVKELTRKGKHSGGFACSKCGKKYGYEKARNNHQELCRGGANSAPPPKKVDDGRNFGALGKVSGTYGDEPV